MAKRTTPQPPESRILAAPFPQLDSDRLRLLTPFFTPRVIELARLRLCGIRFISGRGAPADIAVDDAQWVLKLALLLVLEMNPHERFLVEEEALMRGMDADNVNPHKREGLIRAF